MGIYQITNNVYVNNLIEIPQTSLRQWTLDPSENKLKSLWNGSLAADRAPKKIVM